MYKIKYIHVIYSVQIKQQNNEYLVTGVAGFIGNTVVKQLTFKGHLIFDDNFNDRFNLSLQEIR